MRSITIPTNQSPWLAAYQAVAAEYTKETGVQVQLVPLPAPDLYSQQVSDVQSGAHKFDIYQVDEPYIGQFNDNRWITPFHDIDPSYEPDPKTEGYAGLMYWNAKQRTTSKDGGELVAAPINGNVQLLDYRTDIYEKVGLSTPTTWDDVISNASKIKDADAAKYPYIIRGQGLTGGATSVTTDFLPIFYAFGGNWFKDEGTDWTPTANSSAGVKAATVLQKLASFGPSATNTIGQAQIISAMQSGQAAQTQLVAAASAQLESESDSSVAGKISFNPMPTGDTGKPGVATGVFSLTVPKGLDKERAKAALLFIKWFESKKAQTLFAAQGGIPTRADVVNDSSIPATFQTNLKAVAKSLPYVRPYLRYTFTPQMAEVTEKYLAQIAAGTVTPQAGMDRLNADLKTVIQDAGYPMGAN